MATVVYRCPSTGLRVQAWFAESPDNGRETYVTITCTACNQLHLINRKTGRTLEAQEL